MKTSLPKIAHELDDIETFREYLEGDELVESVSVHHASVELLRAKNARLSDSRIASTDFSNVYLEGFDALNTEFTGCTFTASKFPSSGWHLVLISGARCSGLQMTNSILKNVTFRQSKLELANFRFSNLENVVFEDCVLDDVDFYEARLRSVEFVNCTINNISFSSARMAKVDISGSQLEDVKGINSLKGTIISTEQLYQIAPLLAAEVGIKIK